ncbi:hypothetical protein [Peijinzhouia sedimentorum]
MNAGGLKAYLWLLKWVSIFKKEDYLNSRKKMQTVASRFSVPDGVTLYNFAANGVKCERAIPDNLREDKIVIYFHGGAYVAQVRHKLIGILLVKLLWKVNAK